MIDSTGGDSYGKFIATLDNVSAIEQLTQNTKIQGLLKGITEQITKQTGVKTNFHLALAIISGGEAEYNSGQPVFLHIGMFDVSNLTWKIITKIEIKKGSSPLSNWKIDSQLAIKNSFKFLEFIKTEGVKSDAQAVSK